MHDMWLEAMKWSPTRLEPSYSRALKELVIPDGSGAVEVTVERLDEAHKDQTETIQAKYVVGCDGARSGVRRALGLEMKGDFANQVRAINSITHVSMPLNNLPAAS